MAEEDSTDLDFSSEGAGTPSAIPSPQVGATYDPRPQEDNARRNIAYLLIGLLWLVIVAMFLLIAFGSIGVADVKDFAVILGPIVTLVSAATGFYYGTKTAVT